MRVIGSECPMSVKVRPFRNGGWEVDIQCLLATGERFRERRKSPVSSKSGSQRWGEERERAILLSGPPKEKKEVPTLVEFGPRFLEGHAEANRQKPSGIAAKETILRIHLIPLLGSRKLDAITTEQVQQVKRHLHLVGRSAKTVNNVLTTLNMLLKKSVEWGVIERMPCTIRLLPIPRGSASFYDFGDYEQLVEAAKSDGTNAYLIALLGGEAGLRCGEMMALEWADVDATKRQLTVARSEWKGHVTVPKGGRLRRVPMTERLRDALKAARHLRSPRVLCDQAGLPLSQKMVRGVMVRVARKANVKAGVHILRHTFCSHLAMQGCPARAIQELAGHTDLATTQRYMHLSPSAIEEGIRLLETRRRPSQLGDILETAQTGG
jgi:integrase